jgi:signal peptidase I
VGGDITIDEAFEREALEPGQIITFRALSNGTVITHRIVARVKNPGMSEVHYQTKGDANDAPDPDLAPSSRIIGVAGGPVPWWEALASRSEPRGQAARLGSLRPRGAREMADLRRPDVVVEEAAT